MGDYQPPYHLSEKILSLAMEIGAVIREINMTDTLSARPYLHRANRIRSVYSSLTIENNSLSQDQVSAVLEGKRVLAPPREILEVQNAFRAYELLPALNPFSVRDLLKAHAVMMDKLVPEVGVFRKNGVGVFAGTRLLHTGVAAPFVPDAVERLFDWLAHDIAHPLIKACVFHYEFEFIHPFSDGNGRTGRLWQTLILSKWEPLFACLPVESMILDNRQSYYDALNRANQDGDCTAFVEFMLDMILDALRELRAGQRGITDHRSNEGKLLLMLSDAPDMTIPEMAGSLGLSERQVRRILTDLKQNGRVHREGSNKKGRWIVGE